MGIVPNRLLILCLLLLFGSAAAAEIRYRVIDGAGGVPLQIAAAGPDDAPGVLFIHGSGLSSSSWQQQLESPQLNGRFHLVAFDLRGHGNSGKPIGADDYDDARIWADDVAAVMAATGLRKPVVVAWSLGGYIAMDFLRHYSADRFAGLIMVGSNGGLLPFPAADPESAEEIARVNALTMSPNAGDRLAGARAVVDRMIAAPVPQEIIEREMAAMLSVTPYYRTVMRGRSLDNADLKPQLTMPMLFIVGEKESFIRPETIRTLADSIPGARLSVYPDTKHMPFIEQQQRFDSELAAFVAEFSGKPKSAD